MQLVIFDHHRIWYNNYTPEGLFKFQYLSYAYTPQWHQSA